MKFLKDLKEFGQAQPGHAGNEADALKEADKAVGAAPGNYWRELPPLVQHELNRLTMEQRVIFDKMYLQEAKYIAVAYGRWLLFGSHHGYFNLWTKQLVFWFSFPTIIIPAVWWLTDLDRVHKQVKKFNTDLAIRILKDIKGIANVQADA